MATNRIKVLLVDDHPVVRRGMRSCLQTAENLEIVGEATDGEEALAKVRELRPDIVLMDMEMPRMDGLESTRRLRLEFPNVKILVLSAHSNKPYVIQTIQAGAQGYALKDTPAEDLIRAIEMVSGGEPFFSPNISQIVLNQCLADSGAGGQDPKHLTTREREVLVMIAEGKSNKEMASHLGVGVRTIETHRERVMDKLEIHSVAGLTKYAINNGIVKL